MFKEFGKEFLSQFDKGNWLTIVIISASILLISMVVHVALFKILKRLSKKDYFVIKHVREKFKTPSFIFLITVALNIIVFSFTSENTLTGYVKHALNLMVIFSVAWLVVRLISLGKDMVLRRYDVEEKNNLKARKVYTQFKVIERILNFIVILIALAIALMTFESIRKIGVSLFASAGVAGIILGFAAQKMIGTVLAGFQIAITQPIRLDDVVIVEGEWGWIEEITLTYVVVRIWDKRRLVVPTTYFIEKPFQNWTRVSSEILGTVFIYTDYQVPFDRLREELTRILKSDENWDGNVNVLQVTDATEKTVEIRALMSAVDSPTAWDLRVSVREKLIEFLQKNYPDSLPKTRLLFDNHSESASTEK
ncbi:MULTISPECIES: mechanosensitive ion channel family protein [unclassified Saccharicrinis]|uniref:mechanosensitive ion channel family protein n=1 Tax=unclassified Saccharicrinis TaxID=2646859 RepID=UPI003D349481